MIAEVAINLPLRHAFDYQVPEALLARTEPGSRVIVPFGGRLRSGIVVRLKESSDLPETRLKAISRSPESAPLVPAELLDFTRWVAGYYFCGWGEVLDAALPTGLSARFRTRYQWLNGTPGAEVLSPLSESCQRLVRRPQGWDDAAWSRAKPGPAEQAWLRRMLREGLLTPRYEYAGQRSTPRTETWLRLNPEAPEPADASTRRSPKRETKRELLLRILLEEGPQPLTALRERLRDPRGVARPLAAEGHVLLYEQEAPRPASAAHPGQDPDLPLTPAQAEAYASIHQALQGGSYAAFLLEGVTGSGKTEVYLHAVRETVAAGRSALVLVPEIALTAAMVNRFRGRFGDNVAVLHSGMGEAERFEEWRRVREGLARIVIGARSAVFAPLADLGLVVVDEEHDGSYKQDETPRYNGRDAALVRAAKAGAVAVLGTATASMESLRNVQLGKLQRLALPARINAQPLPAVTLLDLRRTPRQPGGLYWTLPLVRAVRETLAAGKQALLFLNRRGFAQLARCASCEATVTCVHCSITLTYHRGENRLRCHRCDYQQPLPLHCPACESPAMEIVGVGTERIAQDAEMLFPEARVVRMDSDALRRKGELERRLEAIREGRHNLIIGTQILSKGHDFPQITLVAALLADVSLNLPDFRAAERTFQVLTQMAGRAGRGEHPGEVLIQTYSPEHYALSHVRTHDVTAFAEEELALRRAVLLPPYSALALVWASSPDEARAELLGHRTAELLQRVLRPEVRLLGPEEAPIKRLSGRFRWMLRLQAPTMDPIHRTLRAALDDPHLKLAHDDRLTVDVDPYNLM